MNPSKEFIIIFSLSILLFFYMSSNRHKNRTLSASNIKPITQCSRIKKTFKISNNITKIQKVYDKRTANSKIFVNDERLEKLKNLDVLDAKTLKVGEKNLKEHKVIICGISRDSAGELPWVIQYIEMTGELFKDYRVIIFENDSVDGTKKILAAWAFKNPKIQYLSRNYNFPRRPSIKFLGEIRNEYLNELNNNPNYDQSFDIIMVVDFDALFGWDLRGIYHTFALKDQWDVVCANGLHSPRGEMYDMFAFRSKDFLENPISHPNYWKDALFMRGWIYYPPSRGLVEVYSCYGGITFYRRKYINDCKYESIQEDCEIVSFHDCIRQKHGGRIFMNSALMYRYKHYSEVFVNTLRLLKEQEQN